MCYTSFLESTPAHGAPDTHQHQLLVCEISAVLLQTIFTHAHQPANMLPSYFCPTSSHNHTFYIDLLQQAVPQMRTSCPVPCPRHTPHSQVKAPCWSKLDRFETAHLCEPAIAKLLLSHIQPQPHTFLITLLHQAVHQMSTSCPIPCQRQIPHSQIKAPC